jgi:hypothetical protein
VSAGLAATDRGRGAGGCAILGNYILHVESKMCDREAVNSKESAGAPDEIEVTQAMVEAGVDAYRCSNEDFEDIDSIVRHIFTEMCERRS